MNDAKQRRDVLLTQCQDLLTQALECQRQLDQRHTEALFHEGYAQSHYETILMLLGFWKDMA